ncbi:MAG TPA: DEAD/DEAH box helicase [Pirellulales bacterium]|nr:DEAD/DEAH box helicase [Pirellulales bacterium]
MLNIAYEAASRRAVITWGDAVRDTDWVRLLKRVFLDHTADVIQHSELATSIPWWAFLSVRAQIKEILSGYGIPLTVDDSARRLLEQSRESEASYAQAMSTPALSSEGIIDRLAVKKFVRQLTKEQLRNVARLSGLKAGATFSVPGAGKTTEALALFHLRAETNDRLLVIAPKNAFSAWDEQMQLCVSDAQCFVRLTGGRDRIEQALSGDPRFMLITYQQLPRVREMIAAHIASRRVFVFLDESHRIKSGKQRVTAEAVLSLSHLPVGKLLLSGTPMPQAEDDLIPQFSFLYPEMRVTSSNVADAIKPVYVRTTKSELDLPAVSRRLISLELSPVQARLYRLMRVEAARQAETVLNVRNRVAFRALGRSIIRLLQLVSNPSLLAREIGFAHEGLLAELLEEGKSPKVEYACSRARQLARQGKKSLIWTSFVANVELMARRLSDLGAVYIHGGVDAGSEDDEETREGKIKAFHDDASVKVMVANPAAASEGISLHTVCRNAIYVDRTFNAAHYIQSEDRIHRLGLKKDEVPTIEILECRSTIDEVVRSRLGVKIDRMSMALNDPSLNVDPIPFDPTNFDDDDDYGAGINDDDIAALIDGLRDGVGG